MNLKEAIQGETRKIVSEVLALAGDEFAPKLGAGSPERKKLLGLLPDALKAADEATDAILALILDSLPEELDENLNAPLSRVARVLSVENCGWNACLEAIRNNLK